MKEIKLKIKALSPLAISRQKPGGSISEAQDYIPGSVIRGAVAAHILHQPGVDPDRPGGDFQTLFVDREAAIFTNAYPTVEGEEVYVLSATAVSSKSDPGFQSEKSRNAGVFDTLIDRFCADFHGQLYDPNCPKDGRRVEPFSGFYSVKNGQYTSHTAEKRLLTKVGINRRRATAEEEVLYSIQVISEHQKDKCFESYVYLKDRELSEDLGNYLTSSHLRLGGSTSRGLGKVEIQAEVKDYKSETEARVNEFNTVLKERWKVWNDVFGKSQDSLIQDHRFFTLDLQSDAILTEQWRRTMVISPAMLCAMTKVEDPDLRLHGTYSSYDYWSGWNSAWGLMKDVELITQKGAVFLFSTSKIEVWIDALKELEYQGVGDRTLEGFGQVQVCNTFHHIFRENAV
ncbi:CRISPR-associated RAMP protein Csx10 [Roseofilum sp. BLCC_M154]|uniref:CRISPR-associated RAMP protein Csx10 n=1 Tax=Roseofilum acuticapitatum BLCC-M154 TaxID=3022444 RepID=A0ABT7AZM6_9CYAN|nr:CRISPR-associated RAMP protein Csx10 [Roseofilum acuticapitatum]MDJ1172363.1 CRISPR-associated RAMP protein Csx10 [Roseofilum acuticapitatum BLCC-M154]